MNKTDGYRYLTDKLGPLPFCPGCGHGMLIKALGKALEKIQIDPHKVVIVTDIGCIGLSDRYFTTHAFHGLHGRSITYGCGLKLARPELTVIVLQGDGGCGIGGTHLLNVARRNIGISLIVGNNFNYGMTGGQHSVTTPTGGITSTTPWGNAEGPMDICGTVTAAGAAWVYRTTVFDKGLADIMAKAITQPGFAMIDILELCTAYYSPKNQMKKSELIGMIQNFGLKTGLIVDQPRLEYTEQYQKNFASGNKPIKSEKKITTQFSSKVNRQTGIIIAGSAGQKIKSAATLLAQAAMFSGLEASQKDDYPITVMTGHSIAEIIISPERIDYTAIEIPDFYILLSEDGLKKEKERILNLPQDAVLFAEETLTLPEIKARIIRFPFLKTAKGLNRLSITTIAIAAFLQHTQLFPCAAFTTAIDTFQRKDIAATNKQAVTSGAQLV